VHQEQNIPFYICSYFLIKDNEVRLTFDYCPFTMVRNLCLNLSEVSQPLTDLILYKKDRCCKRNQVIALDRALRLEYQTKTQQENLGFNSSLRSF